MIVKNATSATCAWLVGIAGSVITNVELSDKQLWEGQQPCPRPCSHHAPPPPSLPALRKHIGETLIMRSWWRDCKRARDNAELDSCGPHTFFIIILSSLPGSTSCRHQSVLVRALGLCPSLLHGVYYVAQASSTSLDKDRSSVLAFLL